MKTFSRDSSTVRFLGWFNYDVSCDLKLTDYMLFINWSEFFPLVWNREMALEGLCLLKIESQSDGLKYPKLGMLLDYILRQQPKLLESTEIRNQDLLFPSNTYVAMIKFLMKCFESELEKDKSLEGSSEFQTSVRTFCLLLEHSMSFEGSVELHVTASKSLLIIGSHMPEVSCYSFLIAFFLVSFLTQFFFIGGSITLCAQSFMA